MTADMFTTVAPAIPRDGHGRPLIVPPEGGPPIPYTRASTFCCALDDGGGLVKWKSRLVALGIARNPDLAAMAAAYQYGDRELDDVIETAHDRAGGNEKANWGTAVHSYTDPRDDPYVPEQMAADVEAYRAALTANRLRVVATSGFVVNDKYMVAGTFDNILAEGDTLMMSDKKTGTLKILSTAIQLVTYAGGVYYRLEPDGTPVREPLPDLYQSLGIIAHIPKGTGTCKLYGVDLVTAREYADLAYAVRAARVNKNLAWDYVPSTPQRPSVASTPPQPPAMGRHDDPDTTAALLRPPGPTETSATDGDLAQLISDAPTLVALHALWFNHQTAWTETHTELARQRKKALT